MCKMGVRIKPQYPIIGLEDTTLKYCAQPIVGTPQRGGHCGWIYGYNAIQKKNKTKMKVSLVFSNGFIAWVVSCSSCSGL